MQDQNENDDLELFIKAEKSNARYNLGPWVFLACYNANEIAIQRAQEIFKFEQKKIKGNIFCFSKDDQLNHKEKSLVLFFAGLYISYHAVDAAFCLGQLDVLGEQMKLADQRLQEKEIHELKSEDWINWQPVLGEIFIGEFAQNYLGQAGIQIGNHSVKTAVLANSLLGVSKVGALKKVV